MATEDGQPSPTAGSSTAGKDDELKKKLEALDGRVRALEDKLSFLKGGAVVGAAILTVVVLGFLGVEKWVAVPKLVDEQVDEQFKKGAGAEATLRLQALNAEFTKLSTAQGVAASRLEAEMSKSFAKLNTDYTIVPNIAKNMSLDVTDGKTAIRSPVGLAPPAQKWSLVP